MAWWMVGIEGWGGGQAVLMIYRGALEVWPAIHRG